MPVFEWAARRLRQHALVRGWAVGGRGGEGEGPGCLDVTDLAVYFRGAELGGQLATGNSFDDKDEHAWVETRLKGEGVQVTGGWGGTCSELFWGRYWGVWSRDADGRQADVHVPALHFK